MDITIIIATRNRSKILYNTLTTISQVDVEGIKWELIVVNNGSNDDTKNIIHKFSTNLPIVYLEEDRPGKNICLNKALRIVKGKLIVFTDDDITPDKMWLKEIICGVKRWPKDSIFAGTVEPRMPQQTPNWVYKIEKRFSDMAFGAYKFDLPEGPIENTPIGANFTVRSSVIDLEFNEAVGPKGKVYPMGGEVEFLDRMKNQGFRYIYIPSAKVEHMIQDHQVTFRWLIFRAQLSGRGWAKAHLAIDCPFVFGVPRYMWRQLCELSFKYWLSVFQTKERKFAVAKQLHTVIGAIKEYRTYSKQNV